MKKLLAVILVLGGLAYGGSTLLTNEERVKTIERQAHEQPRWEQELSERSALEQGGLLYETHPLQIEYMRELSYPGSELVVEQQLADGSNYERQIVSYKSEGLKQYALLTIPKGEMPTDGWPAIVFNHGYIPPREYRTTERYVAYVDNLAREGFIVFRPDYRGHGNSEGEAVGGYGSPAYTVDVLNGLSSLARHGKVDENRIGMWGHSMGGHITLRAMVINPQIKAGVIWAGVVGSYQDYMTDWWNRRSRPTPSASPRPGQRGYWRQELMERFGSFETNPQFWNSISATTYLAEISGPIQMHHGTNDSSVPNILSEKLHERMEALNLESELYIYEGDDHNLTASFGTAMRRTVQFYKSHL